MPVNAFALPELTTSMRAFPPSMFARQKSTAAEGHFDRVKTPAATVPGSNVITMRSVLPRYFIPACAVAILTPSNGGITGSFFGAKGELSAGMALTRPKNRFQMLLCFFL
jgi:hypothetical protein